ncbi:SGNH/GDSL hydrolase family protein [Ectobacillus antri]|uniref:SGNH/GDSL hydrolase family protein n=1 Tax=Ectobacillus antri TaxID=2486280 RepID=UPI000F5A3252|nr:GDSL-type esterase/lipase family protein [Ectobacillus antri]
MPNVTARPVGLSTGEIKTSFIDTTSTSNVVYTYPIQQEYFMIENQGSADILVTIGGYTDRVVKPNEKWDITTNFTEFTIRSAVNSQAFLATAYDRPITDGTLPTTVQTLSDTVSGLSAQLADVENSLSNVSKRTTLANTVVIFGDSITARFNDGGTNQNFYGYTGYFYWANIWLRQRLKVLNNAGISGNTTTQMLNRIQTDVLAYKPSWCIVEGGVNDVISGNSFSIIRDNLKTIFETLVANNTQVVATTIMPYDAATTAQKNILYQVNNWIKEYCWANPHMILCDWSPLVTNPSNGNWVADCTSDGTHPSTKGAAILGEKLAKTLSEFIPIIDLLPSNNADPTNLCPNGMFDGNAGTGVATSWTVNGGGTYTTSKVTRTDEIKGEWQQINQTVDGATRLQLFIKQTDVTKFGAGDKVVAQFEFQNDNPNTLSLSLKLSEEGGSNTTVMAPYTNDATGIFPYNPTFGVLRTPILTVTNGAVRLNISIYIRGTGTVRIGRATISKVNI